MSSTSVQISEPATSNNARLYYALLIKGAEGNPVAGEELKVSLEGSGSLAPTFDSKEVRRVTDESGEAHVTWYRRNIWGRAVKATMTIDCPVEGSLIVEQLAEAPPEMSGPKTEWSPRRPLKL